MNSRRTVIIAAALALAALAFFGNVYYLNTAQKRAYDNAKLVEVYVVKKAIPKGTDGASAVSHDFIRAGKIPQEYRPGTALTRDNINDIKDKVAINDLSPGQVVVDGQFVDSKVAQVTFAQRIPANQVTVTVSVDQVHGVAGLLVPGDKVDLLVYGKDTKVTTSEVYFTQTMYQNVNILAIGTKAAPQAGESTASASKTAAATAADAGLITFAVPLDAAQRIITASQGANGMSLYVSLVPPENQPVTPAPASARSDVLFNNLPPTPYPAS